MKPIKFYLLLTILLVTARGFHATAQNPYLSNTPLPYMPVKLDVLFIGNSFSISLPTIFASDVSLRLI